MTTTYTTSDRLASMTTGDPAVKNSWGTIYDASMAAIDQALDGFAVVNIGGLTTYSLTVANNASDQSRPRVQQFTGALTANCTVTLPNVPKVGWVQNNTTGGFSVILTAGAGTSATVPPGGSVFLYFADGSTNVTLPAIGPPPAAFPASISLTSLAVTGSTALAATTTTDLSTGTLEASGAATLGSTLGVTGLLSPFGGIVGNPLGVNPAAGNVGEYQKVLGVNIAVVNGIPVLACQLALTPGDWDVWGRLNFRPPTGGTYSNIFGWLNTDQGNFNANVYEASMTLSLPFTAGAAIIVPIGITRILTATPITVFLLATGILTGTAATVVGLIQARRRA